ncbi:MAG TPA: VOC family protein [Thermoplasmata archaeon]|nr:VOC family protein [Thermoplasmata archaeon]
MLELSEPLTVWLQARDLETSRRFYSDRLGLPLWREEPKVALHYGVGGGLLSIRVAADSDLPPRGSQLVFAVGSGIDELCADLQSRGVVFEQPLADRPSGRSAMFRDPDGHALWVCQPSATETQFYRWRLARRVRTRPVAGRRPARTRRHEPQAPSRRRPHPTEM